MAPPRRATSGHRPEEAHPRPEPPRLPPSFEPAGEAGDGAGGDDERLWDGVEVVGGAITQAGLLELTRSRVRGVRFTGATIEQLRATDTVFEDCELSGATITDAVFRRVELLRCRMSGLVADGTSWTDVRVVDCRLDDANLRMAKLDRCTLDSCELRGADLYSAVVSSSALVACNLTGVELSKAKLDDVALHHSTIEDVRGASALRGAVISSEQVTVVSLLLLGDAGIAVDDEHLTRD